MYVEERKEFPHAPEYFFGPGKQGGDGPPWRHYAKMLYHEQQRYGGRAMTSAFTDYERGVLGAVILDNALMKDVQVLSDTCRLQLRDSPQDVHGDVAALFESNRPIDPQTIFDEVTEARPDGAEPWPRSVTSPATPRSTLATTAAWYARQRSFAGWARYSAGQSTIPEGSSAETAARLISDLAEFQQQPEFGTSGEMFVTADRFCSTIP
jgi:hypothetical protein